MMRDRRFKHHSHNPWWCSRLAIGLAAVMVLLFSGSALAAEIMEGDPYILPRGEVINDDLYVAGSEIIIDGTVEGDLVVAGGYIEVNGVVMGDLLAAGGAVVITGAIQDDVRAAGGGIVLSGTVGDDFFAAAGGGWPGMGSIPIPGVPREGREMPQGLRINPGSIIGGDAVIAGGQGTVAGTIGSDLLAGMGSMILSGRVAGNANLSVGTLVVQDSAVVQGQLSYTTDGTTTVPEGVAGSVVARTSETTTVQEPRNPIRGFFSWLLRTALVLAGYLLAGWLLWSFASRQVTGTVATMQARPMEAGIFGVVAAVAVIPVGAALTFLAGLFWGWFPGALILFTFVFGLAALLWLLSPIVTGLWVGRKVGEWTGVVDGELPRLLVGIATIVLVARVLTVIPCVGDLLFQVIYLTSFALVVGAWFMVRRRPPQQPDLMPATVAPAITT